MNRNLGTYMIKSPYVCDPDTPVDEAFKLMHEQDFRHLPVVEEGRLVGIISERDLKKGSENPFYKTLKVSAIMKTSVYAVPSSISLREVVSDMADNKYGSAVVVNSDEEVIGIFTTTDALRALAELLDEDPEEIVLLEDFLEDWPINRELYA